MSTINPVEAIKQGALRTELMKKWIDDNKEYLAHALITERVEITLSMKGSSMIAKVTQFPDTK